MIDIEKWTPLATFTIAYGLALIGASGKMVKDAHEGGPPVTPWRVFLVFTYWAPLSIALPMLVWESPMVGKKPVIALALALFVALGIISVVNITRRVRQQLGLEDSPDVSHDQPRPNSPSEPPNG